MSTQIITPHPNNRVIYTVPPMVNQVIVPPVIVPPPVSRVIYTVPPPQVNFAAYAQPQPKRAPVVQPATILREATVLKPVTPAVARPVTILQPVLGAGRAPQPQVIYTAPPPFTPYAAKKPAPRPKPVGPGPNKPKPDTRSVPDMLLLRRVA
ncbi:hypothetical protein F4821DRAFT_261438 [Hypoxylon rubiginosum]|uniref:Uncharacterized protein n=1 Tax=Hypoxylon rubiginosum TaxID=110542 RepID=A0ACC0CWN2_9PEZI|nr:hypothetical protein F4821DRAFT_261438 [Hypoxylon rubiginosum]